MSALLNPTFFNNTIIQYLIFLSIILGFIIIGKIVFFISKKFLHEKVSQTKTELDNILLSVMEKPVVFLIFIIGLIIGLKTLTLSTSAEKVFSNIIMILWTINGAWFVMVVIDLIITNYIAPATARTKSELDELLLPLIRKLIKAVIIIITGIIIIDNFGYDVTSLLAGLGIGGLAFALAAKDMLSNFFGGMSIIADKPFKIGDRIKIQGYDGWVKEIGLRSTKVETLDGFQLVVPNSTMANSIMENVSKEKARKIKITIGVEYSTSMKKMEEAKKIIEDIIKKNKDARDDSIISFKEFGDSSLNFLVIYWITNLDNILGVQHDINMEIKKQFEKAKIEMAFPSRTIYLKK